MLTHFTAHRYKNVDVQDLEFGRVNVLVGPNNAGKTNFLEAMAYLRDLAAVGHGIKNDVWAATEPRGVTDIRARSAAADEAVALRWWLTSGLSYAIEVQPGRGPDGHGLRLAGEALKHGDGELIVESTSDRPWSLSLGDIRSDGPRLATSRSLLQDNPKPSSPEAIDWLDDARQAIRAFTERHTVYHMARFEPRAIAEPSSAKEPDDRLQESGANLPRLLRRWEQETALGLAPLADWIRGALPDIGRIWVRDSSGSHFWLQVALGREQWTLADLSDGTVRLFVLAALLYREQEHTILAIDEPELNLHPSWQREVARWFLKSRAADQFFVSTHSPELLDGLTEGFRSGDVRLFVFNVEPGRPRIDAVKPERLDELFEEGWALGDVYRVGDTRLGGWP